MKPPLPLGPKPQPSIVKPPLPPNKPKRPLSEGYEPSETLFQDGYIPTMQISNSQEDTNILELEESKFNDPQLIEDQSVQKIACRTQGYLTKKSKNFGVSSRLLFVLENGYLTYYKKTKVFDI